MWTDGVTLGYEPDWVDKLTPAELRGVIAHEVMHIALGHHARRQGRDQNIWNMAGDYAINDILMGCGFALPRGALYGYGTNRSAESIYNGLYDATKRQQAAGGDGAQTGNDPGGCGEVRDTPGKDGQPASESDRAQAESDSKIAAKQAEQAAKMMGKLPGALARMVARITETRVPWREVLRRFIDQTNKADYSWARPNRRYIGTGAYLPSLYAQELGKIAVAVDTSGSIDHATLEQFGGELSAVIGETKATAEVLYCDSVMQGTATFTNSDLPITLEARGAADGLPATVYAP